MFVLAVHPLVTSNDDVFWKNGRLDRDAVWGGASGGSEERCIRWRSNPQENGQILEKRGWRNVTYRPCGQFAYLLFVVSLSCVKVK